jgi:hypothetical protein
MVSTTGLRVRRICGALAQGAHLLLRDEDNAEIDLP